LNCHSVTDANKQFCGVLQEFCGVYTFEAFVNWTFSSVVVSLHKLQSPHCWYVCIQTLLQLLYQVGGAVTRSRRHCVLPVELWCVRPRLSTRPVILCY